MFYDPAGGQPLPFNPFKAIVAPRPIGWISTLSKEGVPNLSPYSFFNGICDVPPLVMFSSGGIKDSIQNAIDTGEFTFNYVSKAMTYQMNASSGGYGPEVNEFEVAGLEAVAGVNVACPRVAGVPAAMECKVVEVVTPTTLGGGKSPYHVVIGQAVGVYIDDAMIADGRFDVEKADPLMRCGYRDYTGISGMFELARPAGAGDMK